MVYVHFIHSLLIYMYMHIYILEISKECMYIYIHVYACMCAMLASCIHAATHLNILESNNFCGAFCTIPEHGSKRTGLARLETYVG